MNATELAKKMLEWQELMVQASAIEKEIQAAVLEVGKTQTVGNVRATFSNGRRTFDYETPAKPIAPPELVVLHTEIIEKIDWKKICDEVGATPIVVSQTDPSVSVKLLA
jgi:hypothetical protein